MVTSPIAKSKAAALIFSYLILGFFLIKKKIPFLFVS